MNILIKSEIDSRVLLYPLMKTLWKFGSILVMTSNKQVNRLIDDSDSSTFRDITIIVDEDGAEDSINATYGFSVGDFDFVIQDNIGTVDYDVCIIPLGVRHDPDFDEEVEFLLDSEGIEKVKLIQFGTPQKQAKSEPTTQKDSKKRGRKSTETENDSTGNYDPTKKVEEISGVKQVVTQKVYKCKFPSYDDIEKVEAEHRFATVDSNLINAFYDIFGSTVNLDRNQFKKVVSANDEHSGYLKSVKPSRVE